MQIIIPINSDDIHYPQSSYYFPKPLVQVACQPMIQLVAKKLMGNFSNKCKLITVMPKEFESKYSIASILRLNLDNRIEIVEREFNTDGGLCSALLAADVLDNDELIIANMDEVINVDLNNIVDSFRLAGASAGVITFDESHPRWCYARTNSSNNVIELAEKRVISNKAVAGFYYFKDEAIFLDAGQSSLLSGDSLNKKFYISSAINQIILKGENVSCYQIDKEQYHSFYTPEGIENFSNVESSKLIGDIPVKINVVVPAAGEGSRFREAGWKQSKPLISIGSKKMIELVINNLELKDSKYYICVQNKFKNDFNQLFSKRADVDIINIERLTMGTACTVLSVAEEIKQPVPLLIANSDQLLDFDIELFVSDMKARALDGSILVFECNDLDSKWSYAKVSGDGLVIEVAEKTPISDLATVGIYLFSKGYYYIDGLIDMIANNDMVNGEYYVCPVYNYMIKKGLRVGVYKIDAQNMHGLGTPDDLKDYLKKRSLFSKDLPQ